MRKAISITLTEDNLLWLKGQAAASPRGSLSEVVDNLVREARLQGRTEAAAVRTVVGTIDLPADDDTLAQADVYIKSLFDRSIGRPMMVKERRPAGRSRRRG